MAYGTIELELRNEDHRAALVRMWKELPDPRVGQVADVRLRWLYQNNPSGAPLTVLATAGEQKEFVGCGSLLPRRMWAFDRMVETAMPCDFVVTKKHRIGGAAIGIQRALAADRRSTGLTFLYGSPNKRSIGIIKRLGYHVIGDAHAWVKPLRSAYKLGGYLKSPRLAGIAGPVLDVVFRIVDRIRVPARTATWKGEVLERADERFDALWERAHQRYRIIGEKTSEFLNWRYGGFTTRSYRIFVLTAKESGAVAGWVLYEVKDDKVFVVDLFAEDLESTLDQLLMGFARVVRREGHRSIYLNYVGNAAFGDRLKKVGFFRSTDLKRSLIVFFKKDTAPALADELLKRDNWLMFDGDMDI